MNEALETLMEARDHARARLQEHEAAISILAASYKTETAAVAEKGDAIARDGMGEPARRYPLGQPVSLRLSGEKGEVIGFATYSRQPPQFLVEYLTGDGRQVEGWFSTEALRTE